MGGSIRGRSIGAGRFGAVRFGAVRLGGSIGSDHFGHVDWRWSVGAVRLVSVDLAVGLG